MSDLRPIGLLDSGVGGLSVLREVRVLLPAENLLYVADQAHLPYGTRDQSEIRVYVETIARFLIGQGCKLIVIACNAANAAALHHTRALFPDLPIVGMEPAIKPAAARTRSGVIGVITTQTTYQGALYASVVDRFAQGLRVVTQVCPDLVWLAEQGAPDTEAAHAIVASYLAPLQAAGVDQVVLGCTHFPFLMAHLRAVLGEGVEIVDPAPAVARQVRRVLEGRAWLNGSAAQGTAAYFTSGDPQRFAQIAYQLTGEPISAEQLCWQADQLA